jgi:hypothetical protein
LLADCTPHGAFCRMEWNDVFTTVRIFRGPEPCVLLVHESIEVVLFSWLQTLDIPTSRGTTSYFSH